MLTELIKLCTNQGIDIKDLMSMYQQRWMSKYQLEQRLTAALEQNQNYNNKEV